MSYSLNNYSNINTISVVTWWCHTNYHNFCSNVVVSYYSWIRTPPGWLLTLTWPKSSHRLAIWKSEVSYVIIYRHTCIIIIYMHVWFICCVQSYGLTYDHNQFIWYFSCTDTFTTSRTLVVVENSYGIICHGVWLSYTINHRFLRDYHMCGTICANHRIHTCNNRMHVFICGIIYMSDNHTNNHHIHVYHTWHNMCKLLYTCNRIHDSCIHMLDHNMSAW